jgi:hypothetical protein
MNVIGHEAVRPHPHATPAAPGLHQRQVHAVIFLVETHFLPAVATLRHMMRHPRHDDPGDSGHERILLPAGSPTSIITYDVSRTPEALEEAVVADVTAKLSQFVEWHESTGGV